MRRFTVSAYGRGIIFLLVMMVAAVSTAGCAGRKPTPAIRGKKEYAKKKVLSAREVRKPRDGGIPSYSREAIPGELYEVAGNQVFKEVDGAFEYIIGPGDVLSATFWKGPQSTTTDITVRPDGKISYTFLEDLPVSGLTASEVDKLITEKLREFVKRPRVDVLVKKYNSKKVALFGEISHLAGRTLSGPNIYPLKGRTELLDLILMAGGQTDDADLSRVELVRKGKLYRINLVKALFGEGRQRDVIIDAGDRVFVPKLRELEEKKVLVLGEVGSPGLLTFKKETTLIDVIAKAGGPAIGAVQDDVHIIRGDLRHPELIKVDLKKLLRRGDLSQNRVIEDKDIVYVPKRRLYKAKEWSEAMAPILDFLLRPGAFRDAYTTGVKLLRIKE